jgi:hypothetical protein
MTGRTVFYSDSLSGKSRCCERDGEGSANNEQRGVEVRMPRSERMRLRAQEMAASRAMT